MKKNIHRIVMVFRRGGDYRFFDALLLAHHIRKHWQGDDLEILCLSDTVDHKIETKDMTIIPMVGKWKGWWSKMNLFAPSMEQYRPFLYLDLDTAVLGDLRQYFNKEYLDLFITLEDFYRASKLATGLLFVPANNSKIEAIWKAWFVNPEKNMEMFRGDQEFIRKVIDADRYFQSIFNNIYSFKPRSGKLIELPKNAKVVCFHGKPRPFDAAKYVQWVRDYISEL